MLDSSDYKFVTISINHSMFDSTDYKFVTISINHSIRLIIYLLLKALCLDNPNNTIRNSIMKGRAGMTLLVAWGYTYQLYTKISLSLL